MHIYHSKIGDQFHWQDCIWSITGDVQVVRDDYKFDVFRECYNHDLGEFYSLHAYVFSSFKPTEWSVND